MEEELVHWTELASFQEPSDWQQAVHAAYEAHQALRPKEKRVTKEVRIERRGAELNGAFGSASTP